VLHDRNDKGPICQIHKKPVIGVVAVRHLNSKGEVVERAVRVCSACTGKHRSKTGFTPRPLKE